MACPFLVDNNRFQHQKDTPLSSAVHPQLSVIPPDSPDPVTSPDNLALVASDVSDLDGSVRKVKFYRDSNSNGTLEVDTDELLGSDTDSSGGWTWTGSTAAFPLGLNRYFARAQDDAGAWSITATTAGTVDPMPNRAPTDISPSNSVVAENQPSGTAVGTFSTTDPDSGNTFTYELVSGTGSTDNGSFTISGNSLRTAVPFDYEAKNSYSIRVRSTDQGGLYIEKVFTITISQVSSSTSPVYRFWSPVYSRHFYTIDEAERDQVINNYSHVWTYEGVAYYAFTSDTGPDTLPVYRFWSGTLRTHFYTISESERDKLINGYSQIWTYEGVAFYAYAEGQQPSGTTPIYRWPAPEKMCQ